MNTTNNTVLVTGGSAGIGLAIARSLSEAGNHIIITGRNAARLEQARSQLGNATAIVCDVTRGEDRAQLAERLAREFPKLNMLINNAGQAYVHQLGKDEGIAEKAADEMLTNYYSILSLNEQLLPLLSKQDAAAIVNVSSVVVFAPSLNLPTYSASKAALHSYTVSLRQALSGGSVKVFELMPPLVNTEFSRAIGGEHGIPPAQVADELMTSLAADRYEIHVGNTARIYQLALENPATAFAVMNGLAQQA